MNSFVLLKASVIDIALKPLISSQDNLRLKISYNKSLYIFKPPFTNLSIQIQKNFQEIELKLFIIFQSKTIGIAKLVILNIEKLSTTSEYTLKIKKYDDSINNQSFNEDSRYPEIGFISLKIIKEILEIGDCKICTTTSEIFTFPKQIFDELSKIYKESSEIKHINDTSLGININNLLEFDTNYSNKIKNIKALLIGVNEKLKILDIYKQKCTSFEEILENNNDKKIE